MKAAGDLCVREQPVLCHHLNQPDLPAGERGRRPGRHLRHSQRCGRRQRGAIARARAGEGPTILELKIYRHGGHSRNDACGYRPKEEEAEWFAKDPVVLFRKKILEHGVITEEELQKEEAAIEQEIEDAVEYAKQAPFPANEDALINVFKEDDE